MVNSSPNTKICGLFTSDLKCTNYFHVVDHLAKGQGALFARHAIIVLTERHI